MDSLCTVALHQTEVAMTSTFTGTEESKIFTMYVKLQFSSTMQHHHLFLPYNIVFIYHIICVQVWDANIIETEIERFYDDIDDFVDAIQKNITVYRVKVLLLSST